MQAREAADGDEVPLVMPDSAGRSGPVPVFRRFQSLQAELGGALEIIEELQAEGRPLRDIVVIARQWWPLEQLQERLERAGIAAMLTGEGRQWGRAACRCREPHHPA